MNVKYFHHIHLIAINNTDIIANDGSSVGKNLKLF
jgi:hypothetical protein